MFEGGPATSRRLPFHFQAHGGVGRLTLGDLAVGLVTIDRLELEVTELGTDPGAARAERFQRRRTRLRGLAARVAQPALDERVAQVKKQLAGTGVTQLSARLCDGFVSVRARAADGLAAADLSFHIELVSTGAQLRALASAIRVHGHLPTPGPVIADRLLVALTGASDAAPTGDRPYSRGLCDVEFDLIGTLLWQVLPPSGWRLPAVTDIELTHIRVARAAIDVAYGPAGARTGELGVARHTLQLAAAHDLMHSVDEQVRGGHLEDAMRGYRALLASGGPDQPLLLERILALAAARPAWFFDGLELARQALGRWPTFAPAHAALASITLAQGDAREAARHLEDGARMASGGGDDDQAALGALAAARLLRVLDPRAATQLYQLAVEHDPGSTEAADSLTDRLADEQRWSELVRLVRSRIAMSAPPRAVELHLRLADVFVHQLGDRAAAQRELAVARELAPDDPAVHEMTATILVASDPPAAIAAWREVARLAAARGDQRTCARARARLGDLLAQAEPAAAEDAWRRSLALDPLQADAMIGLAQAAAERNEHAIAVELYERLRGVGLAQAAAAHHELALARSLVALGRGDEARASLRRATLAGGEPAAEAHAMLAEIADATLDRDHAAAELDTAIASLVELAAGASPEADRLYTRAAQLAVERAMLFDRSGQPTAAGADWQRAHALARQAAPEIARDAARTLLARSGDDAGLERRWIDAVLATRPPPVERAALLVRRADVRRRERFPDLAAALADLHEALEITEEIAEHGVDATEIRRGAYQLEAELFAQSGDQRARAQSLAAIARLAERGADRVESEAAAAAAWLAADEPAAALPHGARAHASLSSTTDVPAALRREVMVTLGEAAWRQRAWPDVIRAYRGLLADPGPEAHRQTTFRYRLAVAADRTGDAELALSALRPLTDDPDATRGASPELRSHALRLFADLAERAGELAAAAIALESFASIGGESSAAARADAVYRAGELFRRIDRGDEAIRCLETALRISDAHLPALDALEVAWRDRGDLERVATILGRKVAATVRQPGRQKPLLSRLGDLQDQLRRPDVALATHQRALEIDPMWRPSLRYVTLRLRDSGQVVAAAGGLAQLAGELHGDQGVDLAIVTRERQIAAEALAVLVAVLDDAQVEAVRAVARPALERAALDNADVGAGMARLRGEAATTATPSARSEDDTQSGRHTVASGGALSLREAAARARAAGRLDEAFATLETANHVNPGDATVLRELVEIAGQLGDRPAAGRHLEALAAALSGARRGDALLELADVYYDQLDDAVRGRDAMRKAADAFGSGARRDATLRMLASEAGTHLAWDVVVEALLAIPGEKRTQADFTSLATALMRAGRDVDALSTVEAATAASRFDDDGELLRQIQREIQRKTDLARTLEDRAAAVSREEARALLEEAQQLRVAIGQPGSHPLRDLAAPDGEAPQSDTAPWPVRTKTKPGVPNKHVPPAPVGARARTTQPPPLAGSPAANANANANAAGSSPAIAIAEPGLAARSGPTIHVPDAEQPASPAPPADLPASSRAALAVPHAEHEAAAAAGVPPLVATAVVLDAEPAAGSAPEPDRALVAHAVPHQEHGAAHSGPVVDPNVRLPDAAPPVRGTDVIDSPAIPPGDADHAARRSPAIPFPDADRATRSSPAIPLPDPEPAARSSSPAIPLPDADRAARSSSPAIPLPDADRAARSSSPAIPLPDVDRPARSSNPAIPLPDAEPAARSSSPAIPLPDADRPARSSNPAIPLPDPEPAARRSSPAIPLPDPEPAARRSSPAIPLPDPDRPARSSSPAIPLLDAEPAARRSSPAIPLPDADRAAHSSPAIPLPDPDRAARSSPAISVVDLADADPSAPSSPAISVADIADADWSLRSSPAISVTDLADADQPARSSPAIPLADLADLAGAGAPTSGVPEVTQDEPSYAGEPIVGLEPTAVYANGDDDAEREAVPDEIPDSLYQPTTPDLDDAVGGGRASTALGRIKPATRAPTPPAVTAKPPEPLARAMPVIETDDVSGDWQSVSDPDVKSGPWFPGGPRTPVTPRPPRRPASEQFAARRRAAELSASIRRSETEPPISPISASEPRAPSSRLGTEPPAPAGPADSRAPSRRFATEPPVTPGAAPDSPASSVAESRTPSRRLGTEPPAPSSEPPSDIADSRAPSRRFATEPPVPSSEPPSDVADSRTQSRRFATEPPAPSSEPPSDVADSRTQSRRFATEPPAPSAPSSEPPSDVAESRAPSRRFATEPPAPSAPSSEPPSDVAESRAPSRRFATEPPAPPSSASADAPSSSAERSAATRRLRAEPPPTDPADERGAATRRLRAEPPPDESSAPSGHLGTEPPVPPGEASADAPSSSTERGAATRRLRAEPPPTDPADERGAATRRLRAEPPPTDPADERGAATRRLRAEPPPADLADERGAATRRLRAEPPPADESGMPSRRLGTEPPAPTTLAEDPPALTDLEDQPRESSDRLGTEPPATSVAAAESLAPVAPRSAEPLPPLTVPTDESGTPSRRLGTEPPAPTTLAEDPPALTASAGAPRESSHRLGGEPLTTSAAVIGSHAPVPPSADDDAVPAATASADDDAVPVPAATSIADDDAVPVPAATASADDDAAPVPGATNDDDDAVPVPAATPSADDDAAPVPGAASADDDAAPVPGATSADDDAAPVPGAASADDDAAPVPATTPSADDEPSVANPGSSLPTRPSAETSSPKIRITSAYRAVSNDAVPAAPAGRIGSGPMLRAATASEPPATISAADPAPAVEASGAQAGQSASDPAGESAASPRRATFQFPTVTVRPPFEFARNAGDDAQERPTRPWTATGPEDAVDAPRGADDAHASVEASQRSSGYAPPTAERATGDASASPETSQRAPHEARASAEARAAGSGDAPISVGARVAGDSGAPISVGARAAGDGGAQASIGARAAGDSGAQASIGVRTAGDGGAQASIGARAAGDSGAPASIGVRTAGDGGAQASGAARTAGDGSAPASVGARAAGDRDASASAGARAADDRDAPASAEASVPAGDERPARSDARAADSSLRPTARLRIPRPALVMTVAAPIDLDAGSPAADTEAAPADVGAAATSSDAAMVNLDAGSPAARRDAAQIDLDAGSPLARRDAAPVDLDAGSPFARRDAAPADLDAASPLARRDAAPVDLDAGSPAARRDAAPVGLDTASPFARRDAAQIDLDAGSPLARGVAASVDLDAGSPSARRDAAPADLDAASQSGEAPPLPPIPPLAAQQPVSPRPLIPPPPEPEPAALPPVEAADQEPIPTPSVTITGTPEETAMALLRAAASADRERLFAARRADPDDPALLLALLAHLGDREPALRRELLDEVVRTGHGRALAIALHELAVLAREARDALRATALWTRAYETDPAYPAVWMPLADAYAASDDFAAARELYEAIARSDAYDSTRRAFAAERAEALGRDESIVSGEIAARGTSDIEEAEQLAAGEDWPGAIDAAERAAAARPEDLTILELLERIYFASGNVTAASEAVGRQLMLIDEPALRARLWRRRARMYREALGRDAEAYRCLKEAHACSPADPEIAYQLRTAAMVRGEWQLAASLMYREIAAAANPRDRGALHLELAMIYEERLDDAAQAQANFEQALAFDPTIPAVKLPLARRYEAIGRSSDAARLYEEAAGHARPADRAGLLEAAARCRQAAAEAAEPDLAAQLDRAEAAGGLDAAHELAAQLWRAEPGHPAAFRTLANLHRASGDLAALTELTGQRVTRAETADERATAWLEVARLAEDIDALDQAARAYDLALIEDPGHVGALDARGALAFRLGDFATADMIYRDLGSGESVLGDDELALRRSMISEQLGRDSESLQLAQLAAQLAPGRRDVVMRVQELATRIGELPVALSAARHVLELIPLDDDEAQLAVRFALVELLREAGQLDDAVAELEKVLRDHPVHAGAIEALAHVHTARGDWTAATRYLYQLVPLAPSPTHRAERLYQLGEAVLVHVNDIDRADDVFLRASDLDPGHVPTLRRLLDVYWRADDPAGIVEVATELAEKGALVNGPTSDLALARALIAAALVGDTALAEQLQIALGDDTPRRLADALTELVGRTGRLQLGTASLAIAELARRGYLDIVKLRAAAAGTPVAKTL